MGDWTSEHLSLWGSFTVGVLVSMCLVMCAFCFATSTGLFQPTEEEDSMKMEGERSGPLKFGSRVCSNFCRATNPFTNLVTVFYAPAATGANRTSDRLPAVDGARALVFLWVLAWQVNYLLGQYDYDYKQSSWYAGKDEKLVAWRIAIQGYEGLTLFLVMAGFLTAHSLLECYDDSGVINFRGLIVRRWVHIWPSLMLAVLLLGVIWGQDVDSESALVHRHFEKPCHKQWWGNVFLIANFWRDIECFEQLWAVSLTFQLYFLAPLPVYAYLKRRRGGYIMVYCIIALSLASRLVTIFAFGDQEAHALGDAAWALVEKSPWGRAAEFSLGMLVAFSYHDHAKEEEFALLDIFGLVTGSIEDWLHSISRIVVTTIQTATLVFAAFFLYEGTHLYASGYTLALTTGSRVTIWVAANTIVGSGAAILLRWALSSLHGGWLHHVLSSPVFHSLSALSYTGFLFTYVSAFWAITLLDDPYLDTPVNTGYIYFSKAYFLTLALNLAISLLVTLTIKLPGIQLSSKLPATKVKVEDDVL